MARLRALGGDTAGMVLLPGGRFLMGTDSPEAFVSDGEGPVRAVTLEAIWVDRCATTNEDFAKFVEASGYVTEAERIGWAFVFVGDRQDAPATDRVHGAEWWRGVGGACWKQPEGPGSDVRDRQSHPVVQVSWNDAFAYAMWAGKRLPTEAEWEYAARGGLEQQAYPWGNELTPGGEHRSNVWQGEFPRVNTKEDGFAGTAPAQSYAANGYGIFCMTGNTWEWTADWFHPAHHALATRLNPVGPPDGVARVLKGGSFLCHRSYCNRYRVAARSSNTPDSATANTGFRCVRDVA